MYTYLIRSKHKKNQRQNLFPRETNNHPTARYQSFETKSGRKNPSYPSANHARTTRIRVSLKHARATSPRILYFRSFNRPRTSNWKKLFHLAGSVRYGPGTNKNSSSRTRTLLNCRLSHPFSSPSLSLSLSLALFHPSACASARVRVSRGECGASRRIIEAVDVMEKAGTCRDR